MSVIYLLISISLIIALLFLYAFFKAVKNGQFDDDYTPSVRVLFDDSVTDSKTETSPTAVSPKTIQND
ncbi:cbb3-type cytochrome oxidase assembly protein CcoS [Flavobacterium sp.]|uniref:cbb3-type cytochrome oxidase assembly protein CcoS n=1 Tax=Flavobacterium sp. TaxID=239 RepID=UPI0026349276|nr:cbb3-type cytochrome oxidase assembly protein CcoS [Flavobacterium sp.]